MKSLENHLKNYVIKEIRLRKKEVKIDDFDRIEAEIKREGKLIERLCVSELSEEEIWVLNLFNQGFKLVEIAERMDISYEKLKDIWSNIKAKINPEKKSRRELRKEWRRNNSEYFFEYLRRWRIQNSGYFESWKRNNPFYFKEWRNKNPEYFRKYQSLRRILGNNFKLILGNFLKFLCKCQEVNLGSIERKKFIICFYCNSLCTGKIMFYDDLKEEDFDKIVIFSNLNSLRKPLNQVRCKRIFIYEGRHFKIKREKGLLPDFSKKKVLILRKSQKR